MDTNNPVKYTKKGESKHLPLERKAKITAKTRGNNKKFGST